MADSTVAGAAVAAVAAPAGLTMAGINLGLEPTLLIAGAVGAAAAILFLDAVPATGDTLPELARTFVRRVVFALLSALIAGYAAPVASPVAVAMLGVLPIPPAKLADLAHPVGVLAALVFGAGAQHFLKAWIDRGVKASRGATP